MKKAFKKFVIITSVLLLFMSLTSYASMWIIAGGNDRFFQDGPSEGELVVAGDSYAQGFYEDEKNRGMYLVPYFQEGYTIEENENKLQDAFYSLHKYILFSISVNDHRHNTHPTYFEDEYRRMIALSILTQKTVFVHSYMLYDWAASTQFSFTPYDYDNMVRKIAADYDNIHYIDMTDCIGAEYIKEDGLHYNKKFNDILYDRIKAKMAELKAAEN